MIREEMKKILSWKKLLCLLGFAVIYFLLFIRPYVSVYKGSYQQTADIAKKITEQYGAYISPEEFEDYKQNMPQKGGSDIDKMISQNSLFQKYDIHTFQEFNNRLETLSESEETALFMEIYDQFSGKEVSDEFTRMIELNIYDYFAECYEKEALQTGVSDNHTDFYDNLDKSQLERVGARNQKEVFGLLPRDILKDNFEVLQFLSAFIIISILFLILPYMVQENRNHMPLLQYSFRKGRRSLLCKLAACVLSGVIIIAIEILLYLITAKFNRVLDFWNAPSASFASGYIGWFPWSLGSTTCMVFLFTIAAALGAAMILFFITHRCRNYITALAWTMPLVLGSGIFGGYCIYKFADLSRWKYLVPAAAFGILFAGFAAVIFQFVNERRRDII